MASDELDLHVPYLRRVALRLTGNHNAAEEVVQESLLRAIRRDGSREPVRNIRAWLCQIVTNVCRERWRKESPSETVSTANAALEADVKSRTPPEIASQREHLKHVWDFVQTLPKMQREVLLLNVVERLSHEQIAAKLNSTSGSVKVSLSSARAKLRARFPLDIEVVENHER